MAVIPVDIAGRPYEVRVGAGLLAELVENCRGKLRKRRVRTSRSSLWRFLDRHDITLKKNFAGGRAAARRRGSRPPALDARARFA